MFDIGQDQAAGLRLELQAREGGPALMSLAATAQPAHGFEWLCALAGELSEAGQRVLVIDGCASERGRTDGLAHALADSGVSHLGAGIGLGSAAGDWPVLPAAQGLHQLLQTAAVSGADAALSRLFAPFASGVLLLLHAPAAALAALLSGVPARVLVPVVAQPQASIDAYGALKWLHSAGLKPVLAPLQASPQVLGNVLDCAQRHLGLTLPVWPLSAWGQRVADAALVCADAPAFVPYGPGAHGARAGAAIPFWS